MKIAGIIAEYNPFHTGHALHIAETRRRLGADCAIVCAMSAAWVQRGEAAIAPPWVRADSALAHGADLVLALPTPCSTASAEGFARGGVAVLSATGVVDALSFGCESGDLAPLLAAAACLDTPAYAAALKTALAGGISFAAAREHAVRTLLGRGADVLKTPNNNLAIEYLRALPPHMQPIAIPRVGAGHDAAVPGDYASASALRALLRAGAADAALPYLPGGVPLPLADFARCDAAVLYRLRTMPPAAFDALDDGGEGLGRRLYNAVRQSGSVDEVFRRAKCKRHAHARLRRMVLWAFLGVTADDRRRAPSYLHVLGMTERGRALLKQMKKTARLPVLSKPAHAARLDGAAQSAFDAEARYMDLFALCMPDPAPCGMLWRTAPVIR